ncbi:MAG: tyrosine decarboxylase MfnA [Candidatus Thermoplasmatota archaeon]
MTPKQKARMNAVLQQLKQYQHKELSFSSGRILGSMCTMPHPIAKKAYLMFLETNLGDPDLFPGTKEIEQRYLSFLQKLLNAPQRSGGLIVSGGTEGNITAMWLAKQRSRKKKEIILPVHAHFSMKKIASLMNMRLIAIPLTKDFTMDVSCVKRKITTNTAAVLGVAGSTELGTIDPIAELGELCEDEKIFLHVDAAFGGYVIPFLHQLGYKVPEFDFTIPGVQSISLDAHKMGYAAIPLGALLIRDQQWFETISVESPYISSTTHTGLLGTRSGGPVAAAYAVAKYLGYKGYMNLVKQCMKTTEYAEKRITDLGLPLFVRPTMNVVGVKLRKPAEVVHQLATAGWRVNLLRTLGGMRLVLMPQITTHIIDEFIPIFEKTCKKVGEL